MREWEPLRPDDAAVLLRDLDAPWWHERDWDTVVPRLDEPARAWLADAVALAHPESPYRDRL